MIRLATWNVNSIRIRLPLLEKLVEKENPNLICLQEVKAKEADFPFEDIKKLGFENIALYSMPGYNGVAILSKLPLDNIAKHQHVGKDDARHISALVDNKFEVHNIYVPAGGDVPDAKINPSFEHKLNFVDEAAKFFSTKNSKPRVLCGDFNIAPSENDVWSHKALLQTVSHTPIEVEKLENFFKRGKFADAIRAYFSESEKIYSWWSYRNPNWATNDKGRRLDHVWVDKELLPAITKAKICKYFRAEQRPSDHVPVIVELKI